MKCSETEISSVRADSKRSRRIRTGSLQYLYMDTASAASVLAHDEKHTMFAGHLRKPFDD